MPSVTLDSPVMATSPHLVSHQFVEKQRCFIDHQRRVQDEERQLWRLEREELQDRIRELEHAVHLLGGHVGSPTAAPSTAHTSTGDEFWRGEGGKSTAHATRTFAEPKGRATTGEGHAQQLSSIAQTPDPAATHREQGGSFNMSQPGILQDFYINPIPAVVGAQDQGSLDGITFKPAAVSSGTSSKNRSRSPSTSPTQQRVPSDPPLDRVPSSESRQPKPQLFDLPASGLSASDLLVKDAGHTPLARVTDDDSPTNSAATPKASASNPTDLKHRETRPPCEHAEGYFPVVDNSELRLPPVEAKDAHLRQVPGDPALTGTLGLSNRPGGKENDNFLVELNSRLLDAKAQALDAPSEASEASSDDQSSSESPASSTQHTADRDGGDDAEPQLKLKPSKNFGSVFGASSVGEEWRH